MFSSLEEDFILSIIQTYAKDGYKYYMAHTITENNNNYDICLYLSKKDITAYDNYTYLIENGLCIYIDSSPRNDNGYNLSTHERIILSNNNVNNMVYINNAEFVYSNSNLNYKYTSDIVQPDLLLNSANSYFDKECMSVGVIFIIIFFLYIFIKDILRVGR